jgi:hypothetical protein
MPQLSQDPYFADTTVIVVTATAPRRAGELLDLGALVLRFAGFGHVPTGDGLHCVPDPGADLATTIQRSGLEPEQVRARPPAAIALAYLDARLTRQPYLVATHGPLLGRLIAAHLDSVPTLADLPILDTARLTRHLFPDASPRLEQWTGRLDTSGLSSRVGEQTRLATALFMHAMREVLRRQQPHDFTALLRIAGLQWPQSLPLRGTAPELTARSAGQDRRLAWTPAKA